MQNKLAKFWLGQQFIDKKKKVLTIIGVFKKEEKIYYCFSETSKELSEDEVSKLEKIK